MKKKQYLAAGFDVENRKCLWKKIESNLFLFDKMNKTVRLSMTVDALYV